MVVSLVLSSCNQDDSQSALLREEIKALEDRQTQAQGELSRLKLQMNTITKEKDVLKEQNIKLEADLDAAGKALENLEKEFTSYRSQYKLSIRERAPGMSIGNFVADGKTFMNVKVRQVTEDMIAFLHDAGTDKVRWESLPQNLQDMFAYEKPGQSRYVTRFASISAAPKNATSARAMFDSKVAAQRKQIAEMSAEVQMVRREIAETNRVSYDAKNRKMDALDLERGRNALSARLIQLEAELRIEETKLRYLMRDAPKVVR